MIRQQIRDTCPPADVRQVQKSAVHVTEQHTDLAPLCVKGWLFPAGECAPVLPAVKHSPLDGGCGPAPIRGGGSNRGNGMACWRRVAGSGSGK